MKPLKIAQSALAFLMVFGLAAFGVMAGGTDASSHREAPMISNDKQADATDLYAFVSPDISSTVTLVANYIPLQQAAGGPNFDRFGEDVIYEINVDTQGLARANITYQFRFRTELRRTDTFLYNYGQVTSLDDTDLNVRQFYSVTMIKRQFDSSGNFTTGSSQILANNVPVPPANVGPRSTPNYEANLGTPAIRPLVGGGQVFAGPRDDPFFVDLGSAFDLLGLRPLNEFHRIPLSNTAGIDNVAGYNIHTISLQVPKTSLGAQNGVIGVWTTSKRQSTRVLNGDGTKTNSGPWVQVSRLAMPLVNEVVVPLAFKDYFNSSRPNGDTIYAGAVLTPEMATLVDFFYPPTIDFPTTNRTDLLTVFVTGIPMVNQLPIVTPSELLRLNMNIPPSANPNRLGVTAGDNAGFPNGRRLMDDVVDIELRAFACSYGVVNASANFGPCTPAMNMFPNNALTDGLDSDGPVGASFPYMRTPYSGYEVGTPIDGPEAKAIGFGVLGAGAGLAGLFIYRRRKQAQKAA